MRGLRSGSSGTSLPEGWGDNGKWSKGNPAGRPEAGAIIWADLSPGNGAPEEPGEGAAPAGRDRERKCLGFPPLVQPSVSSWDTACQGRPLPSREEGKGKVGQSNRV